MTTEYWLQKKTIGGWSHVTSYTELEQAQRNYASCVGNGMSGYSWRLVECNVIKEDMINDVVEIDKPDEQPISDRSWGTRLANPAPDAPKSVLAPVARPWGDFKASDDPGATAVINSGKPWGQNSPAKEHGLAGKVWMVNHSTKTKVRVSAAEVKLMEEAGYIRGGPRTQFEG